MNFREALLRLNSGPGTLSRAIAGFTAREAATCLGISTKQASNYLRRLHHMGFLRRRRTRRLCLWSKRFTIGSKACYRGYMFAYSFSKQGLGYIKWLKETKPIEDFLYTQLTYDVVSSVPEEVKNRIMKLTAVRTCFQYCGPTRNLRIFDNNAAPIADLAYQNRLLADENKKLALDNISLNIKLGDARRQNEETRTTLYRQWAATIVEAAKIKNKMEEWKRIEEVYQMGFESAKFVIMNTSGFGWEQFNEYLHLFTICGWIARNHHQGAVPAEKLAKFITGLGLEDVDTVLWLIDNGFLIESHGKLLYAHATT